MKTLLAPTEDFIRLETTTLDADASAGSNVALTLLNNNGLAQYDYVVIEEGSEKAEIQQINAAVTAGTAIQVATLRFAHKKGAAITKYRYNQRKFYGSTSRDGSYTELTSDGSPVTIQVDDPLGTLLEYSGTTYSYFKATYYNSQTTLETSIDDAVAVLADESLRYCSIYGIRKMAGLQRNTKISDGRIEEFRQRAESLVNARLLAKYTLPLDEIPPLISLITEMIAAGYLMIEELNDSTEGREKIKDADKQLRDITNGTIRLVGTESTELSNVDGSRQLSGKPDGTEEASEDRKFSMSQKF